MQVLPTAGLGWAGLGWLAGCPSWLTVWQRWLACCATGSTSCAPASAACLCGMVTLNPAQSASAVCGGSGGGDSGRAAGSWR